MPSFAACLVVAAVLLGSGSLVAAWPRERGPGLLALPLLTAGAAVVLAGAGRFTSGVGAEAGQELAALACLTGLATTAVAAAWARAGSQP
jgi:hypothetical protein